jgi:secretion/DNA translocation related TadE-like protein
VDGGSLGAAGEAGQMAITDDRSRTGKQTGTRTNGFDPKRGDRGSGTVWMVALLGATWAVAVMAMSVGGVRAARHRAYAAADLAALAAASHAADGSRNACRLAARVARGSGGRLRSCALHGRIAEVMVGSEVRGLPAVRRLVAQARARAGPESLPFPCPSPCAASQGWRSARRSHRH